MLDGMFKLYQRAFIARLKAIQNYLKNPEKFNKEYGEIYSYDLNFRLGRFNNKNSIKFYFKTTRISKCLFARNVWVIYYWFISIGTLIGLLIDSIDNIYAIWYITFCLTVFIIMYVFLGDLGFHETKFKSFNRILNEKINFIAWFQFLKFSLCITSITSILYILLLNSYPIAHEFLLIISIIFISSWISFLFFQFILYRWWLSNKSTKLKNKIRNKLTQYRNYFSDMVSKKLKMKNLIIGLISDEKNRKIEEAYYNYFNNEDLNNFLISFQIKFDLKEIFILSDYFTQKLNYHKSKGQYFHQNKLFDFYKQKFIKIFFSIIHSPEINQDDLKLIVRNSSIIDKLRSFSHPFNVYADQIYIR